MPKKNPLFESIAQFLSYAFIPMLIPTYLFAILAFSYPSVIQVYHYNEKLFILGYLFFTTAMVPLFGIYFIYKFGIIQDLHMVNRKDRLIPQLLTLGSYIFICYVLFQKMGIDNVITKIMICMTVIILVITLITQVWKISAHATGIMGVPGVFLAIAFQYDLGGIEFLFVLSLIIAGSVMSSRLYLNVHTPLQVLAGSFLGLTSGFFTMILI